MTRVLTETSDKFPKKGVKAMTTAEKTATLNDLVKQVIEENPTSDPWEISKQVVAETPDSAMAGMYLEALVPFVRIALGSRRNGAIHANRTSRPNRSRKVEEIRDAWQKVLDTLHAVGDGVYKPLRDCTVTDLQFVIDSRVRHIESVRAQVDYYEALIAAMYEQSASTVGELSGPIQ